MADHPFGNEDLDNAEKSEVVTSITMFLSLKESIDQYLLQRGAKRYEDDAAKFLVIFAAISQGVEGGGWNWQAVRHYSQGLFGALDEELNEFIRYNVPLIEDMANELIELRDDILE